MIDTHAHIDGEEFAADRDDVIRRAKAAGVSKVFVPAIDLKSSRAAVDMAAHYGGYCYAMVGLHPEEVRDDWQQRLAEIKQVLSDSVPCKPKGGAGDYARTTVIAIGEVGLDFYWSREYAEQQLLAFEEQVRWSVEMRLPLMIHCRKAQNEMVSIIKRYAKELPGGVFHCFTGNAQEAKELLQFDRFVLGIGGVLTFKKSHLPEVLPQNVPLDRIVLETDSPYMAPVSMRGQRNEPSYVSHVMQRLAEAYGISAEEVSRQTDENVAKVFGSIGVK